MAFNNRWVQSDLVAEIEAQILLAVERRINRLDSLRGVDLRPAVGAPTNPLAASREGGIEGSFATGYSAGPAFQWNVSHWNDGSTWGGLGETLVPFQWGISEWNGGDVWTGS